MDNKYGLSRNIPEAVKRVVRQKCGFGCVVCGSAIYEYEHFDPEFAEAKEHNPYGITLLCPTDHARKSKGLLSLKKYMESIENPRSHQEGFAFTEWEKSNFAPTIFLGPKVFTGGTSILTIDNELLFGFKKPEEDRTPPLLHARFFDSSGIEVYSIIDNEIIINSKAFDIETVANKWVIRSESYHIDLEIELEPPKSIRIQKLNFSHKDWGLVVQNEKLNVKYKGASNLFISGAMAVEGPCLFNLTSDGKIIMKDMKITGF